MMPALKSSWEKTITQSGNGVSFLENGIVRTLLTAALTPTVIGLGLLAYFIHPSETPIVLHYNVYFGVDLLGIWWQVYALPFLGILFFVGHYVLARRFYLGAERIACYLMLLSAGMLSLGVLIASVGVVFINY